MMKKSDAVSVGGPKWFRPATPRSDGGAAIAIIEVGGSEEFIAMLVPAMKGGEVGNIKRCSILGIDDGLVARVAQDVWHLMPHGGPLVIRQVSAALIAAGCAERQESAYPEAASEIEAKMLETLARAESPLAVSLLLKQPGLWAKGEASDPGRDAMLKRLLTPPLVVVLGGANIGKSSLANALARRDVAIVADQPGTTRDHVGVWLELDGLVVRWIDTPGMRETSDAIESEAQSQALAKVAEADLILICGDVTSVPPRQQGRGAVKTVQLRTDLGVAAWDADWRVSARTGEGLLELAQGIREALVPQAVIDIETPWKFF